MGESPKRQVARAALIVGVANALVVPLSLINQILIGRAFGTGSEMDAFTFAQVIPGGLQTILIANLTVLFIPTFIEYLETGRQQDAWNAVSAVFYLLVTLTSLTALGLYLFATPTIRLVAPGFSEANIALCTHLFRILLVAAGLSTLGGALSAVLNAYQHFLTPAMGPILLRLTSIVLVWFWADKFGIYVLAWVVLLSAMLSVGVQLIPFFRRINFNWRQGIYHPLFRDFVPFLLPLIAFRLLDQGNAVVTQSIASTLPEGSVASLGYARRLYTIPSEIFIAAISTAIYPTFAQLVARGDKEQLGESILFGLRLLGLLVIPTMALTLSLGTPIVKLVYERGAFTAQSTRSVVAALNFYALGLLGIGCNSVLGFSFWAQRKYYLLLKIIAVGVAINVALNFLFVRFWGHAGLALATSVAYSLQAMVMAWALKRGIPSLHLGRTLISLGQLGVAGFFAGGLVGTLNTALRWPDTTVGLLVRLVCLGSLSLIVFGGVAWMIRNQDAKGVVQFALRRIGPIGPTGTR